LVEISSQHPVPKHPPVWVPPLMSETKFWWFPLRHSNSVNIPETNKEKHNC
jgi:hypothetical protein